MHKLIVINCKLLFCTHLGDKDDKLRMPYGFFSISTVA